MPDHQDINQKLIAEFRTMRDAGADPLPGRPVVLLTTTGAHSAWAHIVGAYPFFAQHQGQVRREIPVVSLVRRPD